MSVITESRARRPLALGPHALAQRVPCTICSAGVAMKCVDDDGAPRRDPHHSRWISYLHVIRQRPFTAVVCRADDPRLAVGDVLTLMTAREGRLLDVLPDGARHRDLPAHVDPRTVEFQAFVEEPARRAAPRRVTARGARGHTL